jgi:hypothetical protein
MGSAVSALTIIAVQMNFLPVILHLSRKKPITEAFPTSSPAKKDHDNELISVQRHNLELLILRE